MKCDIKKVGKFLASLPTVDYAALRHLVQMRDSINRLLKDSKMTKSEFCEAFEIKPDQYKNFTLGNFNYTLEHMATLNAEWIRVEMEKLKDKAPIQISKNQNHEQSIPTQRTRAYDKSQI